MNSDVAHASAWTQADRARFTENQILNDYDAELREARQHHRLASPLHIDVVLDLEPNTVLRSHHARVQKRAGAIALATARAVVALHKAGVDVTNNEVRR